MEYLILVLTTTDSQKLRSSYVYIFKFSTKFPSISSELISDNTPHVNTLFSQNTGQD